MNKLIVDIIMIKVNITIDFMLFNLEFRMIHFGTNPIKGGIPDIVRIIKSRLILYFLFEGVFRNFILIFFIIGIVYIMIIV
jgi:hypothetical protein